MTENRVFVTKMDVSLIGASCKEATTYFYPRLEEVICDKDNISQLLAFVMQLITYCCSNQEDAEKLRALVEGNEADDALLLAAYPEHVLNVGVYTLQEVDDVFTDPYETNNLPDSIDQGTL